MDRKKLGFGEVFAMKKIILLIVFALIVSANVFAASSDNAQNSKGSPEMTATMIQGYDRANIKSTDSNKVRQIEQIMERIRYQERTKLNQLNNLTFEEKCDDQCNVIAFGKKEAKLFGLFKFQKAYRYEIQKDGEMQQKKRFYDYLWKFEN